MARTFDPATEAPRFELPGLTRQQIAALILDLDCDARTVVIEAIAQLWKREIGEPERDFLGELDTLAARVDALEETR